MDAHNVSALCVESLFHTSEERTREIDLGALADLPDTLQVLREMASGGTESAMYELRLLKQKVTDLEAMIVGVQSSTAGSSATTTATATATPNADALVPTVPKNRSSAAAAAAAPPSSS